VRVDDLRQRDVGRRAVDRPGDSIRDAAPAVWTAGHAPDREGRAVPRGEGRAARRGRGEGGTLIHVAPSPGDSLPELRADPITTIPSPELRRRRSDDRTGYGTLDDDDRSANPVAIDAERWNSAGGRARSTRPRSGSQPESSAPATGDESRARPRSARENDEGGTPQRDEGLLRRFFRSIQDSRRGDPDRSTERPTARPGEEADRPSGDSAARRPRPNRDDDSSARSNPEPRRSSPPREDSPRPSRPSNTGAERSRPERSSPPAEARPRGGDERAAPRPRKPDGI
jgi:hypothetical protein